MKKSTRRSITGYLFLLPWIFSLLFFIGFPFVSGFYFSFCDFPPLQQPVLIGMDNYSELLSDPVFGHSLGVTLIYAAVSIPLGVIAALTLALLLSARIRGMTFYRVIFYLPHLVPTVAVAVLWIWIFNPKYGLLNAILGRVMKLLDAWTDLFWVTPLAGDWEFKPAALLLFVVFVMAFLRWGPGRIALLRSRTSAPTLFGKVLFVVSALGVVAVVYAALSVLCPVDIRKIHSPGWLSDGSPLPSSVPFAPCWALWALVVMSLWGVGQMAVIYLAKLQDVPVELYEAAEIDGANWLQKTWQITVPMISPVILFNVVMAIIGTFQVFAEPYIMTGGGPEDKTRFVAMFIYDLAFRYQRLGYASAVSWVLFLLIVALTILAFRLSRKHVYYEGR